MSKPVVGVLGGTFDPIHHGHLFLALEALHACRLDRVLFVPNRIPPHKAAPGVGPEERWQLLELAIASEPRFTASRLELDRVGPSYTLDTVEELAKEQELVFICGADAFNAPWHRLPDVVRALKVLLIAHRHGVPRLLPRALAELPESLRGRIRHLDFPDIAISSSAIRERIARGLAFRYLLPEAVHDRIVERGLYLDTASEGA